MNKLNEMRKLKVKEFVINELNNKRIDNEPLIDSDIFFINREGTIAEILDTPLPKMNIAMHNYICRRLDFLKEENEDVKVFYGHASNGLGYFIDETEIIGEI